jgi:hypothetical protein
MKQEIAEKVLDLAFGLDSGLDKTIRKIMKDLNPIERKVLESRLQKTGITLPKEET